MVRLQLSEQEIVDISEALDDPNISDFEEDPENWARS